MVSNRWTPDDDAQLRKLREARAPAKLIAHALGRSAYAIESRVKTLRLPHVDPIAYQTSVLLTTQQHDWVVGEMRRLRLPGLAATIRAIIDEAARRTPVMSDLTGDDA
jgi:hypothetical protein